MTTGNLSTRIVKKSEILHEFEYQINYMSPVAVKVDHRGKKYVIAVNQLLNTECRLSESMKC